MTSLIMEIGRIWEASVDMVKCPFIISFNKYFTMCQIDTRSPSERKPSFVWALEECLQDSSSEMRFMEPRESEPQTLGEGIHHKE